ncbi:WYL domain-containing protein [Luteimicrobium xylanilyticum]|uniref:Putative HTH-type transcriptional regulator YobV n=1 Tax=Luteimicrobium xylanilyticum TaxID=1133546 RepID=A0A5P9QB10_9MICO|nr:YafY family protein [Luteimicrobium xylanilyticum]QFU98262.1 putative HTH-type transcriptional regulator YobV [Luteimicrobium xylanilyticum]
MRADRLVATLLLLQSRGRATAGELAAELEVSVATARRDLEALSSAGIPVYPQPGRGGGWQLVGGARTDLTGLTAEEARALFLLVGSAHRGSAPGDAAGRALRKVLQALPATFRAHAEAAADAVGVDPLAWGSSPDTGEPPGLDVVRLAVVDRVALRLVYMDHAGARSERTVEPWGLVDKDGVAYLVAGTERGRRTFRLDRVVAAEATGRTFERPSDLDVDDEWIAVVAEVEERRSGTWATVVVDRRWVPVLRTQFGRHLREVDAAPDGRARVRVADPTPLDLARHLAGWGAMLEVEDPPAVRAELARIGSELVRLYAAARTMGSTT